MLTKERAKQIVKQAGLMDMLGGAADTMTDYAPEGLGALMGAGSAAGLGQMAGLGNKGGMIAAAIGATIGAMATNKMKEHEQAQTMGIDSNSMLGINNALMNLDQQTMIDPYGMMGGMMPPPGPMMDVPPEMGGEMPPAMDSQSVGGAEIPQSNPISGFPNAQRSMQGMDKKASDQEVYKLAAELVDSYFG